jgi:uncharacterized protein (TIGR03000 family)
MKTSIRIALCLLVFAGVATWNGAQEKAVSTITITVPADDKVYEATVVKVNGKKLDGEGGTRTYKASLEKGKEYTFKIVAVIQPTNYETITRVKEITLKGGANAAVDMTVKNFKTDKSILARYVPTPDDIVDEMSKLAKVGKNDVVYDLGCGDARMLIRPIQKFGAKRGVGVEFDPKVLKEAKENVKKAKLEDRIELREGDMLDVKDMSDATVVLVYIGDLLGERVGPVLRKTLKPGSRIVSHRFSLGDWEPTTTVTIKGQDGADYDLLLWVVGEKKIDKGKDKK